MNSIHINDMLREINVVDGNLKPVVFSIKFVRRSRTTHAHLRGHTKVVKKARQRINPHFPDDSPLHTLFHNTINLEDLATGKPLFVDMATVLEFNGLPVIKTSK